MQEIINIQEDTNWTKIKSNVHWIQKQELSWKKTDVRWGIPKNEQRLESLESSVLVSWSVTTELTQCEYIPLLLWFFYFLYTLAPKYKSVSHLELKQRSDDLFWGWTTFYKTEYFRLCSPPGFCCNYSTQSSVNQPETVCKQTGIAYIILYLYIIL